MLERQVMSQLKISIVDSGQFMGDLLILSGEVAEVISQGSVVMLQGLVL
jgi:hypothetical protein